MESGRSCVDIAISEIKWKKPIAQLIRQDILGKNTMHFAAKTAEEIMRNFTPMDTGNLSNDPKATAIKNPVNIIAGETIAAVHYTAPYAAAVFYNKRGVTFRKTYHPLATQRWDVASMQAGGKERLVRALKEYIKRKRGGGI